MSKVWVVGGGPSGLSTAIAIKVNNPDMDVWVLDKDKDYPGFAGPQRCAGGVNQWFLDRVGLFRLPNDVVSSVIHRFRVYAPNMKDCWEVKAEKPLGYVIDRNLFERWLATQAQKVGALIRNYNVTSESLDRCHADCIVGADGLHSTVARWAGASKPSLSEIQHCVQKTIGWDGPQDIIGICFSNKIAPRGYAWCFPAGKGRIRVGLGVPLSLRLNPSRLLEELMLKLGFGKVEHLEFISKLVPVAKPRKSNVFMNGRVMLVGDAGLHTDPLFGGGIVQGIIAGEACGRAIAEGNPFLFDKYASWLTKHNRWRYKLKKILMGFSDRGLAKFIEMLRKLEPPEEPVSVTKELKRVVRQLMWRKPSVILKLLLG